LLALLRDGDMDHERMEEAKRKLGLMLELVPTN
jgi:hypothetical protein